MRCYERSENRTCLQQCFLHILFIEENFLGRLSHHPGCRRSSKIQRRNDMPKGIPSRQPSIRPADSGKVYPSGVKTRSGQKTEHIIPQDLYQASCALHLAEAVGQRKPPLTRQLHLQVRLVKSSRAGLLVTQYCAFRDTDVITNYTNTSDMMDRQRNMSPCN